VKTDAERYGFVRDKAQSLLHNWQFLRGEPDENVSLLLAPPYTVNHISIDWQGKSSNFAHECLKQACIAVFYSNKAKSLRQFPEMQDYIPYKALVFIATFVSDFPN
jgi:hypothetical protein